MKLIGRTLVLLVATAAAVVGPGAAGAAPTVNASVYEPMIFGPAPGGGTALLPGVMTLTTSQQFVQIVADISGAASFAYDYSTDGGASWTTFCSGTLPPELVGTPLTGLSCTTYLTGVPDGAVIFRASATDTDGVVATSRTAGAVTVARSSPAPQSCNAIGRVRGEQHFSLVVGTKKRDVHVEAAAICGVDRETGTAVVLRLAKVKVTVGGGPPLIDAKQVGGRGQGEVSSVTFTAPGEAVITGSWDGVQFTVTLHDGGRDSSLDAVRVQYGSFDTATLSSSHGDVHIDAG